MRVATAVHLTLVVAAATAIAGDDATVKAVREAWAAFCPGPAYPGPNPDDAKRNAWLRETDAAFERFAAAFGRSDWDSWKAPADRALLRTGLLDFLDLSRRLRRWDDARRALEAMPVRLPDDPVAVWARRDLLVNFLLSTADLDGAARHCAAASATLSGHAKALNDIALGDVRSALGDPRAASAAYAAAEAALTAWDHKTQSDGTRVEEFEVDGLEYGVRRDIEIRRSLLGRATTTLSTRAWVGAPTVEWPSLHGRIVLVVLCGRDGFGADSQLTELDRFARAQVGKPLQILAVVHPSGLPPIPTGKELPQVVASYRDARKLSYPFAVLDDAEYEKLVGSLAFASLVADDSGTIVHASLSVPDHLAAYGIAEALATKLAAPPPADKPK